MDCQESHTERELATVVRHQESHADEGEPAAVVSPAVASMMAKRSVSVLNLYLPRRVTWVIILSSSTANSE
jgi:hypothetical protein